MESLSIILATIGVSVLIFSVWNHLLVKRHLKGFKNNFRHTSSLNDEKYFELKSKQEYIIAASTVIFAVLSFIGFSSIKELRAELNTQITNQIQRLDTLKATADSTTTTYLNLDVQGRTLQDSFRAALNLVDAIKNRVLSISGKDIIRQNIFIVDPLKLELFPLLTNEGDRGYRLVRFGALTTVSGQRLPIFKFAPSIICFSTTNSSVAIKDITTNSFKLNPQSFTPFVSEESLSQSETGKPKFSLWISQKGSESMSDINLSK